MTNINHVLMTSIHMGKRKCMDMKHYLNNFTLGYISNKFTVTMVHFIKLLI